MAYAKGALLGLKMLVSAALCWMMVDLSMTQVWLAERSEGSSFNITVEASSATEKPRMAVLVPGQLNRLEWRSKVENVLEENAHAFEIQVFMLLDQFSKKGVSKRKAKAPNSPLATKARKAQDLLNWALNVFGSNSESRVSNKGKRRIVDTVVKSRRDNSTYNVKTILRENEYQGVGLLNLGDVNLVDSMKERAEKHHDQWRSLRQCAILIEEEELRVRKPFDMVLKLRDDTLIHAPFNLSSFSVLPNSMISAKCGDFFGVNDHEYLMGRQVSTKILRGLSEDYYFGLRPSRPIRTPEEYLSMVAKYEGAKIEKVRVCDWPLSPMMWTVSKGPGKGNKSITIKLDARIANRYSTCLRVEMEKGRYSDKCVWRPIPKTEERPHIKIADGSIHEWAAQRV